MGGGDDHAALLQERRSQIDALLQNLDAELRASSGLSDAVVEIGIKAESTALGGRWLLVARDGSGFVSALQDDEEIVLEERIECAVITDINTVASLAAGEMKPAMAILRGKVSYTGDYKVFGKFSKPLRAAAERTLEEIGAENLGSHLASVRASVKEANPDWSKDLRFVLDESHPEWVADANVNRCKVCLNRFGFLYRKHHCRLCGCVVCANCSYNQIKGHRVCTVCYQERISLQQQEQHKQEQQQQQQEQDKGMSNSTPTPKGLRPHEQLLSHIDRAQKRTVPAAVGVENTSLLATTRSLLLKDSLSGRSIGSPSSSSSAAAAAAAGSTATFLAIGLIISRMHRPRVQAACACAGAILFMMRAGQSFPVLSFVPTTRLMSELLAARPASFVACVLCGAAASVVSHFFGRLVWIYSTAGAIIFSYYGFHLVCKRLLRLSDSTTQRFYDMLDAVMAPWACQQVLELRSVFVKFGQYIGSRADIIPISWSAVLAKLQDDMPADSQAYVDACIEEQFGKPASELFETFDYTPLASASVAQVHKAVFKAGQVVEQELEVAVKVQHEGIEPLMRSDVVAFRRIVGLIAWLNPRFDIAKGLLAAWEKEMIKELDFLVEAGNLTAVRANLRAGGLVADSDFDYGDTVCRGSQVLVPKPVHAFVARRAFCMTFIQGFKITDREQLDLFAVDRCALLTRVVQAYSTQLYVDGLFNCDPHPGNIFVSVSPEDGAARPVLLDFGMVVTLPYEQRIGYCKLVRAISGLSVSGVSEAIASVGYKNSQSDLHPERDLEFFSHLLRDTGDRRSQRKQQQDFRKRRQTQRKKDLADDPTKQGRFFSDFPDSLIFLFRVLGLIRGLCATLDAPISYLDIMGDYAKLGIVHDNVSQTEPDPKMASTTEKHTEKQPTLQASIAACLERLQRSEENQAMAIKQGFCMESFVGAQVCILEKKKIVVDAHAGVIDELDPKLVDSDTLFPLLDLTRLLPTLVILAKLQENIKEHDLVKKYWPSFYHKTATIAHVLSHSAQLEDLVPPTTSAAVLANQAACLARFQDCPHPFNVGIPADAAAYTVFSQGYALAGLAQAIYKENDWASIVSDHLLAPAGLAKCIALSPKQATNEMAIVSNGFAKMIRAIVLSGQPIPVSLASPSPETQDTLTSQEQQQKPIPRQTLTTEQAQTATKSPSKSTSGPHAADQPEQPEEAKQGESRAPALSSETRLPTGIMLDPCCVNSSALESAFVPSFGAFASSKALAKAIHHGLFQSLSKRQLRLLSIPRTKETSPLFGKWTWGLGFRMSELAPKNPQHPKLQVLLHHSFGGSLVLVVPDREIVITVLVNCLTLDRNSTREILAAALPEYDISSLFEGGLF